MSNSTSPPPLDQELSLPTTDRSSSSDDEDVDDAAAVDDNLVVAIHHRTTHGDEEGGQRPRWWSQRPIMGMPPAPALSMPWFALGRGSGGGEAPAPAASIAAVPTVAVSEPGAVCAICKDDLPLAAAARRLPCGHLYHSSCIVPWLEVHNSCPICRCRLPSGDHTEPAAAAAGDVQAPPASEQDPPPVAGADLQLPAQAVSREGEETTVPSV